MKTQRQLWGRAMPVLIAGMLSLALPSLTFSDPSSPSAGDVHGNAEPDSSAVDHDYLRVQSDGYLTIP
ncbi:hypothetical protein NSX56_24155, partial [Salmonella enterica]|nr:hypothetical protein [Salmonella enterica]